MKKFNELSFRRFSSESVGTLQAFHYSEPASISTDDTSARSNLRFRRRRRSSRAESGRGKTGNDHDVTGSFIFFVCVNWNGYISQLGPLMIDQTVDQSIDLIIGRIINLEGGSESEENGSHGPIVVSPSVTSFPRPPVDARVGRVFQRQPT